MTLLTNGSIPLHPLKSGKNRLYQFKKEKENFEQNYETCRLKYLPSTHYKELEISHTI